MADYAFVHLWDTLVGAVTWDDAGKLASFQFDRNFLTGDWDIAPIRMPLSNGDRIYSFPELASSKELTYSTFNGLPGLLADSLPDRYGNQVIEAWLARNGRPPESMNPVEKLCFIGHRGMGALEFEPASFKQNKNTFSIEVSSLVEIAQKVLSERAHFAANVHTGEKQAMNEILRIGTSAGGVRPKAVIAFNSRTKEVRSGQTAAPKGFEHWLIKLDGVSAAQFGASHGWGRVEYAYHLMAASCGIEMTACDMLEENGRAHFMTRRFDREDSHTRHHIQTLCAIQHFDPQYLTAYSYEQVFQTMRMLHLTYPEAEQMFRRMVFNVFATNCDDHTKNISFLLKKGEQWRLAPAYDVCFAYDIGNIWVNQQTLSINGKRRNITKEDLMSIARSNGIKRGEKILEEVNETVKSWPEFAGQANVGKELVQHIHANLHTI